jgi:hypothetical protein
MTLKQCITCIASLFPAWDPPLITLKAGTGNTKLLLPARLAMCCTQRQINVRNNFKWIDIKLVKQIQNVENLIKRDFLYASSSLADSKRNSKNSICTKLQMTKPNNRLANELCTFFWENSEKNYIFCTFCLHQPHSFLVPSSSCTM